MNYRVRRMLGLETGPKRAAVLGCGPAGLFAAHAMITNGWDVRIFSKARKSHLYGAQYLHAPIDGLSPLDEEPETIKYQFTGLVDDYRLKVYGLREDTVLTSVQTLEPEHQAWDLREAYDHAWRLYGDLVVDVDLSGKPLPDLLPLEDFRLVVSTVPLPTLCYQPEVHRFHSTDVWAYGDAPDRGQLAPYRPAPFTVECNGTRDVGWYRSANIYGHVTMEWPSRNKPPLPGVAAVTKPLYTDCSCYRDGSIRPRFVPLGRYGQWSKGVLTHHAYTQGAQL